MIAREHTGVIYSPICQIKTRVIVIILSDFKLVLLYMGT